MLGPTPLRQERNPDEPTDWGVMTTPVLTLALQALDRRVLLWLIVLGAGVVWGFTVVHPDPWRIIAASLYSVLVLFPFVWRDR